MEQPRHDAHVRHPEPDHSRPGRAPGGGGCLRGAGRVAPGGGDRQPALPEADARSDAKAQRAMGWPEQVTAAARESLMEASKVQAQTIDRIVDAWEQQLKSSHDPAGMP